MTPEFSSRYVQSQLLILVLRQINQSTFSILVFLKFILILSSLLLIDTPSSLFFSDFSTKTLYLFSFFNACHTSFQNYFPIKIISLTILAEENNYEALCIITVYCKNYAKFINIIFGQTTELFSIKPPGIFTTVIPGL